MEELCLFFPSSFNKSPRVSWLLVPPFDTSISTVWLHCALLNCRAEIDLQTLTRQDGEGCKEDVGVINMTGLEVGSRLMWHSLFPTVH